MSFLEIDSKKESWLFNETIKYFIQIVENDNEGVCEDNYLNKEKYFIENTSISLRKVFNDKSVNILRCRINICSVRTGHEIAWYELEFDFNFNILDDYFVYYD